MPPVNAPWNKYEAALLIEACNQVASGLVAKKEVVSALSRRLRNAAQRMGLSISETYRNESGISFQMVAMSHCLKGESLNGLNINPSRLFEQIASLYKENDSEFSQLLITANKKYPVVDINNVSSYLSYSNDYNDTIEDYLHNSIHAAEPSSVYSSVRSKFIEELKADILSYCVNEYAQGRKTLLILKILREFSIRLIPLNITTPNLLGLWIANNFKGLWVANLYILLNKSNFHIDAISIKTERDEIATITKQSSEFSARTKLQSETKPQPNTTSTPKPDIEPITKDTDGQSLITILLEHFKKGYRVGSIIERKKLGRLFKEKFQRDCPIVIDNLDNEVRKVGITYSSIVYFPELMIKASVREELHRFIDDKFASGLKYINYASLSHEFHEELLDSQITNDELLKLYLSYYFPNWHYKKDFVCIDDSVEPNVEKEVFDYVRECGHPVTEDDVANALFHLPKDRLHQAFSFNADVLISTSRNGERYHIDILDISDNELQTISSMLYKTISDEEYTTWDDLSTYMHNNHADIFERNALVSEIGIRNGLRVRLAKKFNFNKNLISLANKDISVERIVRRFIKNRSHYTLEEILNLSSEFGTGVCWDELFRYSVRVDASNFVEAQAVNFDIEIIDQVIDELCGESDYMPVKAIVSFSQFPSCRYQWNLFLLENYVARHSRKFRIVHKDFNRNCVKGAIVRKESKIKCISDIVLDQLLRAPKLYNEQEILDLLKDEGYIARSRFGDINHIIERAATMRQNI